MMALRGRCINSIPQEEGVSQHGLVTTQRPKQVDGELGPAPESPVCGPRVNITESLSLWTRASPFWEESPVKTTLGRLVLILRPLVTPDNTQICCLPSSQPSA